MKLLSGDFSKRRRLAFPVVFSGADVSVWNKHMD